MHMHSDMVLHFGPAHPAAHGVMRMVMHMHGEWCTRAVVSSGLLHRGTEKICELHHAIQCIGYMDRLDYVSMVSGEHVLVMSIEHVLRITTFARIGFARVILLEVTRCLNHMLNIACHAGDLGCLVCLLWLFEDREQLYTVLAECTGARLHTVVMLPGCIRGAITPSVVSDTLTAVDMLVSHMDILASVVMHNRTWSSRLSGVGVVGGTAMWMHPGGVIQRCTGSSWDIRATIGYEVYDMVGSVVVCGVVGDSSDRVWCRMLEVSASAMLVGVCVCFFMVGCITSVVSTTAMESVIASFCHAHGRCPNSSALAISEVPKGEMYVYIMTQLDNIYRIRCRCPDMPLLEVLLSLCVGVLLGDVVALVGTVDIVFGGVDM
nr:NADH dehydrogenase subunit 7 [Artemidia motanka]